MPASSARINGSQDDGARDDDDDDDDGMLLPLGVLCLRPGAASTVGSPLGCIERALKVANLFSSEFLGVGFFSD